MDEYTFQLLKESRYYHPEITDVIVDPKMMMEMAFNSFSIAEKGYDTMWDSSVFNFAWANFKDGLNFLHKQIAEKGIKHRLIIEITNENIDKINTLIGPEIRHLDGLRGNFGIFDKRAYMVHILHKINEPPDQTLWSNSKVLVEKQQIIFDNLWKIGIPLDLRKKELEIAENPNYQKKLIKYSDIQNEIISLIEQTRRELVLFSSTKILTTIFHNKIFLETLSNLLRKDVSIRILTDDTNLDTIKQVKELNKEYTNNSIQFKYTNKLGNIDRFTIINDGKLMLQMYSNNNNIQDLVASLSNEEHKITVQEILFEKYWNEINSLAIANNLQ